MKVIASLVFVTVLGLLAFSGPGLGAERERDPLVSYDAPSSTNLHVDTVNGDDNNDGLTAETAFATIQKGIDTAKDGDVVAVLPGVYKETINFKGKAITVKSAHRAAVLEAPGTSAVRFSTAEGPDSVLRNFVIRNSQMAVFVAAASPTITHVTVVGNEYGIGAYGQCQPNVSNSIFWNNSRGNLFGCEVRYSCFEGAADSEGNISVDPLLADPDHGDYTLLSERGRYWMQHNVWILDEVTSPCIDAGAPSTDCSHERQPNGGRANMGAHGGTPYASMSERAIHGDIGRDTIVSTPGTD